LKKANCSPVIKNYKLQITNYKSRDELWLGILAGAVALGAFLFYFHHHVILLYGDAVAHINIARRVFDSRDPGPLQLGTVWLPLPHVLMLPLVISRWMWQTGTGGAIPSMAAYVAGALGLFRLVRRTLEVKANPRLARIAAWFAGMVYVANPNLIYLQTTAMTEPLYLALFIWATVFFSEFVSDPHPLRLAKNGFAAKGWATQGEANRSLRNCGILLILMMLTRYDGWFAGVVFGVAAFLVSRFTFRVAGSFFEVSKKQVPRGLKSARNDKAKAVVAVEVESPQGSRLGTPVRLWRFALLLAAVPVLWLVYNAAAWGGPLAFATGPYSARAIEQRAATPSFPHHPGYHSVGVAALYFLKDTQLNLGEGAWGALWVLLAAAGTLLLLGFARQRWPLLLLWIPLPFYALSIARGGVWIYFPEWWPNSYTNTRYGLQLLPAVAVFVAVVLWFVLRELSQSRFLGAKAPRNDKIRPVWTVAAIAVTLVFVGVSYASVWQSDPICLREARANSLARAPFDRKLAEELRRLPAAATVLMTIGDHVGAFQQAGIPFRRTINETTHPYWEQALLNPAQYADYAIAFGDDAVAQAVRAQADKFEAVGEVDRAGQARAVIYRRR
jgi:hypothetical protein